MEKTYRISDVLTPEELGSYKSELDKENYYSRYLKRDSIAIFTLRALHIIDESLEFSTKHFIHKDDKLYLYEVGSEKLTLLDSDFKAVAAYLFDTHNKNTEIIDAYYDQIEELEDLIYEQDLPRHYIEMWFDLKRSVLKIERYYTRAIKAVDDFAKHHSGHKAFSHNTLDHLTERMQSNANQSSSLVAKLDTIYNYYTSVKNEKLNKNIYLLTLLSGIFLPLNLIVGFFGMNTENLFFKEDPKGTIYVLGILVSVFFFFTIGYKILQLLDSLLLRYGLGKYKLYKVVSDKLQKIESVMDTD